MNRAIPTLLSLFVLAACDGTPSGVRGPGRSAGPISYRDERANMDVTYPANWFRARHQLTILGNPRELLALGTFPLAKGGGCAPKKALANAGSEDAIVFLVENTATAGESLQPRLRTFAPLPQPSMNECWDVPVSTYDFRDSGGRFQIDVWTGANVSDDTVKDVIRVIDSLRFGTQETTGSFFDRIKTVIREREMGMFRSATNEQRERATGARRLRAQVRRKLAKHHPRARIIDVELGIFVSTNERLGLFRRLTYVVHTGPFATGDCLDFYAAKTLDPYLGSCFLTDRDL